VVNTMQTPNSRDGPGATDRRYVMAVPTVRCAAVSWTPDIDGEHAIDICIEGDDATASGPGAFTTMRSYFLFIEEARF